MRSTSQHNLHVQDDEAERPNFIEGDFVPLGSKDSAVNHDPMASEPTSMKATYRLLKVTFSGDKVSDMED